MRLAAALLSFTVLGCGSAATIHRQDGSRVQARIVGSTEQDIYIRTFTGAKGVPREEITYIDHPGKVSAAIGATLAGAGVLQIALVGLVTALSDSGVGPVQGIFMVEGGIMTLIGTGMLAEGLMRYDQSQDATIPRVQPTTDARSFPAMRPAPTIGPIEIPIAVF